MAVSDLQNKWINLELSNLSQAYFEDVHSRATYYLILIRILIVYDLIPTVVFLKSFHIITFEKFVTGKQFLNHFKVRKEMLSFQWRKFKYTTMSFLSYLTCSLSDLSAV